MQVDNNQSFELIRWGISIGISALAGLLGVIIGAWLSGKRERERRRHSFIERQLREFYSPLLSIRNEIRMRSELRERIRSVANAEWQEMCRKKEEIGVEALQKLTKERGKQFDDIIEYDNKQLKEELIPAYRQMVCVFRDNFWLAEAETKTYFEKLIEFVEIWDRWLEKSLPGEVLDALDHNEKSLFPFYDHLLKKQTELRNKLKKGSD